MTHREAKSPVAAPRRSPEHPASRAPSSALARALWLAGVLSSCSSSSSGVPEKASADAPPTSAPASTSSGTASARPPAPAPRELSPPAAGASREDRERAALALLSGNARAAELPLADTDPGAAFERILRFSLQTRMSIRQDEHILSRMDEAAVSRTVEAQLPRLRRCYAEGLFVNPNLLGRVSVRIVVRAAGKPIVVENSGSEIPDSLVTRCVLEIMKGVDFPAPQGAMGSAVIRLMLSPG